LSAPLLQIEHLTKHFPIRKGFWGRVAGQVQAVHNVSLEVMAGETLGIVGESGCGKSTLGRCVLQLIQPTSGRVALEGTELTTLAPKQLRPLRRQMQIIFQNPYSSLDPRMTIGQTVAEPLEVHHVLKGCALKTRVAELLDQVGLPSDAADRYPHEFSGGQRQRVGIARAIALNPKIIIADECVSALDVSVQAQILNLLQALKSEYGLTYLFISHNLSVVQYISDRVAVMYLGQIVELAPADRLYQQPLHPYSQALLSAIPVPDPTRDHSQRKLLQGDLPDPANPPSGCRFHTRCPYATEVCQTESPLFKALQPDHWVACHHLDTIHPGVS
jgi:oligopeptide transport system ATP-binding protein